MKLEKTKQDLQFNKDFPNGKMSVFQVTDTIYHSFIDKWCAQIEYIIPIKHKKKDRANLGWETNVGIDIDEDGASLGLVPWEDNGYNLSNVTTYSNLDEFITKCYEVGLASFTKLDIEQLKNKITPEDKLVLKFSGYIQLDNSKAGLDALCDIEHYLYVMAKRIVKNTPDENEIDFCCIDSYNFDGDVITIQQNESRAEYHLWKKNEEGHLEKVKCIAD